MASWAMKNPILIHVHQCNTSSHLKLHLGQAIMQAARLRSLLAPLHLDETVAALLKFLLPR